MSKKLTNLMFIRLTLGFIILICGCAANTQTDERGSKHDGIIYRNPRVYNVDYFFELHPDPNKIDRNKDLKLWIPIPREWASQRAVKIISAKPEPHAKYVDPEYGNPMLFWDFGKEPEKPSYRIDIKYRLQSYEIYADIDPDKIGTYDKTSEDYILYTRSTHTVSITPKVRELARIAIGDEQNPYRQASKIFGFVREKMRYGTRMFQKRGIREVLDHPFTDKETGEQYYKGVCDQYSAFFVALCRAVGIPARSVVAFIGWNPEGKKKELKPRIDPEESLSPDGLAKAQFLGVLGGHRWAEVFIPDYGWIPVDPTYNKFGHINNKYIITSKNRDIKIGPRAPQSQAEGYGTAFNLLNNGRVDIFWYGVWNIAKAYPAQWGIVHHVDPSTREAEAMRTAAKTGALDQVKAFLKRGIDVNATDESGQTALHLASKAGHKEIVELLLANGADVNIGEEYYNKTAAEYAMGVNDEIVELLISKGADISPLHFALYIRDKAKAKSLIEDGADVNKRTPYGTSPLHRAIKAGFDDIVKLLIDHGADVNAKDNWNWTPLHCAAFGHMGMVELLIGKGANLNAKDGAGRIPLWYAQDEGHTKIVKLLRKHGAKE